MKLLRNWNGFIVGALAGLLCGDDYLVLIAIMMVYAAGMCSAHLFRDELDRKYGHH